jgi:hypothetical protein
MVTREQFLTRMNFRVAERASIVAHLEDFVDFDPHAKPAADAYLAAHERLIGQLQLRGVTGEGVFVWGYTSMNRDNCLAWAKRFATLPGFQSMVEFARKNDAALAPFIQAHEESLAALQRYIQSRVETPPA